MLAIQRIHHVSALGGPAQETVDFYREILQIDLIKATVNFANPEVYHLFFANNAHQAKGAMTYFDWSKHHQGTKGGGQGGQTAFRIPDGTLDEWDQHLQSHDIETIRSQRYGKETLEFQDQHQIDLALVESEEVKKTKDIYDFHGFELLSTNYQATAEHLESILGMIPAGENGSHLLFDTAGHEKHRIIIPKKDLERRGNGIGTVDHLALEVEDKEALDSWAAYLEENGFKNTDLTGQDTQKSIYYREPGNVRIELATKGLGMMTELESSGKLGTEVVIPDHFKEREEEIKAQLPPLKL